jgi:hypothetical protein
MWGRPDSNPHWNGIWHSGGHIGEQTSQRLIWLSQEE